MKHDTYHIDEALLLVNFAPQELAELSAEELVYLATMGVDEDLPIAEGGEYFSPDQWKEQFISFIQSYHEAERLYHKKSQQ